MIVDFPALSLIIKNNPNKQLVTNAQAKSKQLKLFVLGQGIEAALIRNEYFENADVFTERNRNPTSNADLYARILAREEMVFTAKGGASFYPGLTDKQTQIFDATLDKIRFNSTIRKWIKEFALQAYRVDPMGVLFVEVDAKGNAYPTYKSIDCVFDYLPNGRKLEYVCFRLTINEARQILTAAGIDYTTYTELANEGQLLTNFTNFYRFVDDAEDRIIRITRNEGGTPDEIHSIKTKFKSVPGIIASDIVDFMNNQNFLTPVHKTVELSQTYLQDRSIRDLSKKFNGFAKSFEPLVTCGTCMGTGQLAGKACPDCSTNQNQTKGTGYKLRTKVADSIKVPLPAAGQPGGIKMADYFGYSVPPIDIWDKQDTSLNDIENAMTDTYWGTTDKQSTTGPQVGVKHAFTETATKTLADLKPIYARLNKTADWAESTENAICTFIGQQTFPGTFKTSNRTYGRYYILETPDELMDFYLDMKQKGAPQTTLFDALNKYYHAVFENNTQQLSIHLKLVDVEPFIHQTLAEVQVANPPRIDFFKKQYYGEWLSTKQDSELLAKSAMDLIGDLETYAGVKMVKPENLLVPPVVSEIIKTT